MYNTNHHFGVSKKYQYGEQSLIFGKIEYLNLLPFHVFMKRFISSSQQTMSMNYKKGVPSKINKDFLSRRVDAAFISSIRAKTYRHVELGIIAKKEVHSVLVIPHAEHLSDKESETSNVLARVLGMQGEVIIGDKALRYYLQNSVYVDLAKEWNNRYKLPFVFALLSYHKEKELYTRVQKNFLKQKIKIPRYILQEASLRTGVSQSDILDYLQFISYRLDQKAQLGLKRFYKEVDNLRKNEKVKR